MCSSNPHLKKATLTLTWEHDFFGNDTSPQMFHVIIGSHLQDITKPRLFIKSVNPNKYRIEIMSKIVNQMLDATRYMSKRIVRMQDSWFQIIEVLDQQCNEILEIKNNQKYKYLMKFQKNHNILHQESPTIP